MSIMEQKAIIGYVLIIDIVNIVCKAWDQRTFETDKVLQLTKLLGIHGKCTLNIKDIIQCWCMQNELPSKSGLLDVKDLQNLLKALNEIQQKDLANKICALAEKLTSTFSSCPSFDSGENSKEKPLLCSVPLVDEEEESRLMGTKEPVQPAPGVKSSEHCFSIPWPSYNKLKWLFTVACSYGVVSTLAFIAWIVYLQLGSRAVSVGMESSDSVTESSLNFTSDPSEDEEKHYGLITIAKTGIVDWNIRCPAEKYSFSLSNLHTAIKYYGVTQVGDQVWLCGGIASRKDEKYDQSKTCWILNLLNGQWRSLDHQMKQPRTKPWMFVKDNKVIVRSGLTSDIHSKTGCRATQEVYDADNPSLEWSTEDIEENKLCTGSSQNLNIICQ